LVKLGEREVKNPIKMYLIDMVKRVFFNSQGRLKILPWGFHLVEDLVPLYQMANNLKKNQISAQAKKRLNLMLKS
jgi:hypothetical protein